LEARLVFFGENRSRVGEGVCEDFCRIFEVFTPVVGPIFRTLSTRLIEGFQFADCLIFRFYFVPNPSNLVSQDFLCAKSLHTLNRGMIHITYTTHTGYYTYVGSLDLQRYCVNESYRIRMSRMNESCHI